MRDGVDKVSIRQTGLVAKASQIDPKIICSSVNMVPQNHLHLILAHDNHHLHLDHSFIFTITLSRCSWPAALPGQ